MAVFKTIQFLPEIFRTDTNRKFLNATTDQLVSEPNLTKINGYIGRKLAPSYKNTDSYITEPSADRQNYQLEPTVIIKDPITGAINFSTTYTDIINKIGFYGGLNSNHNRLFDNEYYSYDPQIDLDKFVNFVQYYWLENGPDEVLVSASNVALEQTFDVTYNATSNTYNFTGFNNIPNPYITLARGGTYTFNINEPGNKFYIQSTPGSSGTDPNANGLDTRSVLGVNNNGQDVGSVVFKVPAADAQVRWTDMTIADNVNFATNLSYQQLQGCLVSDLETLLGGIDGPSSSYDNLSIVFVNNSYIDDVYWHNTTRVTGGVIYFDQNELVPLTERTNVYQVNLAVDEAGNQRIYLLSKLAVNNESKIRVVAGAQNAGKEFYKRLDIFNEVPLVTAPLNLLYYQSNQSNSAVGGIRIVDYGAVNLDPATEIEGQSYYTSPTGVVFTNGLKVTFDSSVYAPYANNTYYVEGVGTAIRLVLASDLIVPELDNNLANADYITINRSSADKNAWSRSNRWFHVDVIEKTAQYNNVDLVLNQSFRAQRPIIEFNAGLQLFNFGSEAKTPIDILDDVITNAYTQVQGIIVPHDLGEVPTSITITVNGESVTFTSGSRVIFSNDTNLDVRNKIFDLTIEAFTESASPIYRVFITESTDTEVLDGHTVSVILGTNGQKQWHFNGSIWLEAQQKTTINQSPLFDIITTDGVSLGNNSVFPQTNFMGTKLFSYKIGTGANDSILGFPTSYKNLLTLGDIIFENNYDLDTFAYRGSTGLETSSKVNIGVLQKNVSRTTSSRLNIWKINQEFSKQYQLFSFVYDGVTNLFPVDIIPERTVNSPNLKVSINNVKVANGNFAITKTTDKYAILVNSDLLTTNDVVFISIFNSQTVSKEGFYEVPVNFDINALNNNITNLTLGQVRNHLIAFKNNSSDIVGDVPGKSNIRDLSYTNRGGSILQHSAPAVYAGLFLNHPEMNFVDAIRLAAKEYSQFKIKFLEFAGNLEIDRTNIAASVDTIIQAINAVKNSTFPWQYSDMVPYGDNEKVVLPSYQIFDPTIRAYEITRIFQDTVTSNKAVLVYITRTLNGVTTTELLVKGRDYYFSQARPAVVINDTFTLLVDDILTIVEYNNTDGSYIPETPTKLGIYPKFAPEIYTDDTYRTPIQVIQGHDGSITPAFGDYRDQLLLELERRIYNNIKVEYNVNNFNINDYVPGKFRILDYTRQEFNQILSRNFLSWVGTNRVDFTTNGTFTATDPFTWNYKKFRDVVNGESLPGTWRSVFKYFFDTDRPHTHPWEMLGFSEMPDWWEDRYGPAPYTGGNIVLWSDLESGYIHAGSRAGIDFRYSRPGLTSIIPVDDSGNLRPPSEFLVSDFDSLNANTSFAVGDIGPAELAWRRSSEFPFALHFALALSKPARYFSLLIDVENYTRDYATGQFLFSNDGHLTPTSIGVNGYVNADGTIERTAGYVNWIRDYVKNLGIADASALIKDNLPQITVQLSYKMAGYSDKRFLELLAEQFSPSSISDSVVIPDENYSIQLYKGAPVDKLIYSAVIVEKSVNGWTVSGYDTNNPYFSIIPSLPNNNSYTITVDNERGVIYKDFKKQRFVIPYGFEFNKKQQVVDFLVSYQRYLISQGFIFEDRDNLLGEKKDWILSAKEFLHWSRQGWKSGNLIVLSPISDNLRIFNNTAVVDEITNSVNGSKILDVNFTPIRKNNFTVSRENGLFTVKSLANQTIGLAVFNLVQYEHLLVLDNTTVFNDVIYVPETGNRQYRLKLIGAKTGAWNGSLELPGYVFSDEQIDEWLPGVDYLKGTLVKYKTRPYTALQNISAADQFQVIYWKQVDESTLQTGMINNFATNASQSLRYYDINDQPLDENLQLFSNGLIGFRPRQYFTNLGIDVTTQSKFYQGLITQSGTINAINAFQGAQFNNLATQPLNLYENWAIRVGEYGSTEINDFVEFILPEGLFKNNPAAFEVNDVAVGTDADITIFDSTSLYKHNGPFSTDFLRTQSLLDVPPEFKQLPVAGFVNIDDIDNTIFNMQDYANHPELVTDMGTGYKIWTARDFDNNWNVYRATVVPGIMFIIRYNVNSQAQFVTNEEHGLAENDLVALKNFDPRYDGIYRVDSIVDSTRFLVTINSNLKDLIDSDSIIGEGLLFKLVSGKISDPTVIVNNAPYADWVKNDRFWVENIDTQGNWGVYTKQEPWSYRNTIELEVADYSGNDHFGKSIALDSTGLYLYSGAPDSGFGRVNVFARQLSGEFTAVGSLTGSNPVLSKFGKVLATGTSGTSSFVAVAAPATASSRGAVYVYENKSLIGILSESTLSAGALFGSSLAMSDDCKYLYVGAPGINKVYCYSIDYPRTSDVQTLIATGDTTYTLYLYTAKSSTIIVTSPLNTTEYLPEVDYTVTQTVLGIQSITAAGSSTLANGTYTGIAATGGAGSGAKFDITRTSGVYSIGLNTAGSGYTAGNTLTIPGTSVGGSSPANDISITVDSVLVGTLGVNAFTASGSNILLDDTYYGVSATGGTGSGAKFVVKRVSGLYTVTIQNAGTNYTANDVLTIPGTSIDGVSPTNNITITVGTVGSTSNLVFTVAPISGYRFSIIRRTNRYTLLDTISGPALSSNFGSSLVTNSNGSTLIIGANSATVDGIAGQGAAYAYHRTVTEIATNGLTNTFTLPDNLGTVYRVYLNDQLIYSPSNAPAGVSATYYAIGLNQIQYGDPGVPALPRGNKIFVETNQFVFDQEITPEFIGLRPSSFGSAMALCKSGCNAYISSSTYEESAYRFGLVTRYVNVGRVYGTILGTVTNPTVTPGQSIVINNRVVTFTGTTLSSVIGNINEAAIPGVVAVNEDNKLRINSDVAIAANKLNILSGHSGTPLADLGIELYKFVQIIKHPENVGETLGSALAVDQNTGTLAIASDGADIALPTPIDTHLPVVTTFDGNTTKFAKILKDSGAVYIYNLLANPYESIDNPSLFAYGQKLTGPSLNDGFNFGASIGLISDYMIVGVSNDYNIVKEGGSLYYYFNPGAAPGWELTRFKEPRVDTGAVTGAFLYNTVSQQILDFFDYLDPAKGKLLGIVDQDLDHKEDYDPASYNNSARADTINNAGFYWSDRQIGHTWWDLSTASFVDYEQDILTYRIKNWARLFPGSVITIYEWVESDFLPSQYATAVGDGVAKYPDDSAYSSVTVVDPATGIINQKYYYWVSGKTGVDVVKTRRTLSIKSLEEYIRNPKDQNIPYLALLAPNAVAMYNVINSLTGNDVAIHINTSEAKNSNLIHTEWQLVNQGATAQSIPLRAISKLKDSLTGFDVNGALVPDPSLAAQEKLGISVTPRQTMVNNRIAALKNYVETLNTILMQYPILLISSPSKLEIEDSIPVSGYDSQTNSVDDLNYIDTASFPDGYRILIPSDSSQSGKWTIYSFDATNQEFVLAKIQSYKTSLFWEYTDWYDSTYQDGKDIKYILNIYSDTQAITPDVGDYIKILDNGQNKWLLYEVLSDYSFSLIAAESGTLQIKPEIYDVTKGSGFDTSTYDAAILDPVPIFELRNIYDSVYEQILIGNLSTEFNNLFLTMLNFIFTEQKNPDWVFKTSFIDIAHSLRGLEQFPNFVRDNQSFYNDYIDEIKPYRTQLREYIPNYYKVDLFQEHTTDFDLPSQYDARYKVFRSPDISLSSDADLFTTETYSSWANNYTFKVTDYIVGNIGLNYTLAPNVEITGGGGSGAAAITTLYANGSVSGITVISPGSGYTSTPNVFINGDGVGATAYPLLKNEFFAADASASYNLVRSIDTTIKFDRLAYGSNLVIWEPNTSYANTIITSGNTVVDKGNIYVSAGNIVVYNNQAYQAINANAVEWTAHTTFSVGSLISLNGNTYITTGDVNAADSASVNTANVQMVTIFDFTRFSKIDSGNVLLNGLDRIEAYYSPTVGMPGKSLLDLLSGQEYPATSITGPEFRANAFEVTSDIMSFSYEGLTINSGNVTAFNFIDRGFELDQTIRIAANVPFDFQNNGYYRIIGITRDTMTLTGKPIETTYKAYLDKPVTVNVGDYITQGITLGNARVLKSATNASSIDFIYTHPGFLEVPTGNIYANLGISKNGLSTGANITSITSFDKTISPLPSGGNVEVTISYLDQQFIIDSNIYSTYLDTALGTRPQDINIVGGAYVDIYSSYAPEEFVPGRMYDALEMRVFSNTIGDTSTYGFRVFQPMSANIEYTRISANATTTLSSDLHLTDDEILVTDASILPEPAPAAGVPGIVFINGERIYYYQKYDAAKMSTAVEWTSNTAIPVNTLISFNGDVYLTKGNVFAESALSVNTANIQLITLNSLRQIRRGVDGTGAANVVLAGNVVSDSSLQQLIPNAQIYSPKTITGNVTVAANVTYKLQLSSPITANIGDYITQFVGNTGNARVLYSVTNANTVAINFVTGSYLPAANIGTRVNIVSLTTGLSSTSANVISANILGSIYANGNVVLSSVPVLRSNIWEEFGTTLQNSTTIGATFIKAEPSYKP